MDSMSANDEVTTKEWDRVIRVNAVAPGGTLTNIQVVPVEGTEEPKIIGSVILPVDGGWSAV